MRHLLLLMLPAIVTIFATGCSQKSRMVTGGFSENGENGISIYDFDTRKGTMDLVSSFNAGPNPSYLCIAKDKKLIYTINEVSEFKGMKGGGLTTFSYENNFDNLKIAGEISIPTEGPCYVSISPDHGFLLIANYGGASVAVVKLSQEGIPETVTDTIIYNGMGGKVSHPHMIDFDPAGEKVYMTDLGLDRIMIYTLDKLSGKLIPFYEKGIYLAPYAGPRHFVFNGTGTMLYVMGELNSAVTVFRVDKLKGLLEVQTVSSLRDGFTGKSYAADIHIGKSGEFLYATNRGENSVVTFRIGADGLLTLSGHSSCGGDWPRNFAIDPTGKFLLAANQKSGNISVFKIDPATGIPDKKMNDYQVSAPACLKFK